MVDFDFSFTGPKTVPQRTDRTPEDWLSSTAARLLGHTPHAFKPATCPAEGPKKEFRDISGLWMGELTCSKQKQSERYPTRDGSWQARPGRSLQDLLVLKREVPHYKRN